MKDTEFHSLGLVLGYDYPDGRAARMIVNPIRVPRKHGRFGSAPPGLVALRDLPIDQVHGVMR